MVGHFKIIVDVKSGHCYYAPPGVKKPSYGSVHQACIQTC